MEWFALYRDGELLGVRQWYGTPTVRDFGVGELVGAEYKIVEIPSHNHYYLNSLVISLEA
jgi:hypothetical protein